MNLSPLDAAIIIAYFILVMGVGAYLERRAGKNVESYFLAGKTLPWWMLGMSGSSSYFDISGTMWMVSVFYVLGMRGMWEHWMWCFPFAGFMLAYKAKWAYRSGVLTGMEWLVFRFGDGKAGQAARLMLVITNLLNIILMLGYAGVGIGIFVAEFVPYGPSVTIPFLFGFTGLYVLLGGFFGVVYNDFIQTILLSFAAVYISAVGFLQIDPVAFRQTVGDDWFSLMPVMHLNPVPKEYPDPFGLLVMMWLARGLMLLVSAGGGTLDFQRFRAARNEADAAKVGLTWGTVISIRWGLVMGFTAFGLSILSQEGVAIDSESVLPMVLNRVVPAGMKGLVIAGLFSAFMSTFDSTLNCGVSFIVNDLVKPVWKSATQKELVRVSYVSTAIVVGLGIWIGLNTERIAAIWNPINFALGAAMLAPMLFAGYWWRMGGWAVCISSACTLPVAFFIKAFTDLRELQYFPILTGINIGTCLIVCFLFPPAPKEALMNFYRRVRPFGLWGPVKKMLIENGESADRFERDRWDIPVAIVGMFFFIFLYIMAMDTVVHNWPRAGVLAVLTFVSGLFLYFFWWRKLEAVENDSEG